MNNSLTIDPVRRDKIEVNASWLKPGQILTERGQRVVDVDHWNDSNVTVLTFSDGTERHLSKDTKVSIWD